MLYVRTGSQQNSAIVQFGWRAAVWYNELYCQILILEGI